MRLILTCLALAAALPAQPPIPSYGVKRAAGRIVIDGKLDEKAWQEASTIEFVFPWDFQTGAKQKTTARLLWDDDYLYVGYECEDKDIVALRTERDDPTYQDDAVEIFINPRPSQTGVYFGLEMNARAVLYDYVMVDARYAFKRFNMQGVLLATFIRGTLNARGDEDQGWSLEVAIPWANFEELARRPTPGTIWTANLNRWDGVEPDRRLSMWSDPVQPRAQPHVPARFGQLVFVQDAK
ncbi:MAG TPA: carbohydrate-binding family 9-like protein [Bryobacteraceae bacterium]|nr:carbohydrate-binding family 9-like protein [Bryobacteraceae bacterium]